MTDASPALQATGTVLLYLDQADWSYLADGKFPVEEAKLRRLGEQREVLVFVSFEHLIETSGLTRGYEHRMQFVRAFPGAVWLRSTATDLLNWSALHLCPPEFRPTAPFALHTDLMCDVRDLDDTQIRVFGSVVRWSHNLMARATRAASSSSTGATTRKAIEGRDNLINALLTGDHASAWDHLQKQDPDAANLSRTRLRAAVWLSSTVARLGNRTGLLGPIWHTADPMFRQCVAQRLPPEVRRRPDALAASYDRWREMETRLPSLACVAGLTSDRHYRGDAKTKASDLMDVEHAAYAPVVDVFTTDRRNVAPLEKSLARCEVPTRIVRTGRLPDVVRSVERLLGRSPGADQ